MIRRVVALLALTAIVLPMGTNAAGVGEKAPAIKTKTWFNAKVPVNWSDLKGRVILIERWTTT
jgi:hypothetical protein